MTSGKPSTLNFHLIVFANYMPTLRMPKNNPLAANIFQLFHTANKLKNHFEVTGRRAIA
jgi:hypothetical protein